MRSPLPTVAMPMVSRCGKRDAQLAARAYVSRACGGNRHTAPCSARTDSGGQCSTAGMAMGGTVSGAMGGTVSGRSPIRTMSRAIRPRFAPAAAPTIVVMTAMSPAVALNPSSAPTRAPRQRDPEADRRGPGRPVAVDPGPVGAEADRRADGENSHEFAVEGHCRQSHQHDDQADEPSAEAEHQQVDGAQHRARLAPEAAALVHPAPHQ